MSTAIASISLKGEESYEVDIQLVGHTYPRLT